MNLAVASTVFPLVFLGELPDKTMFASLTLASRGRPASVWLGAAAAFTVHVVIAVAVGAAVVAVLPHRVVLAAGAAVFAAGAVYSWVVRNGDDDADAALASGRSARGTVAASAGVIFVAEWGDLTQIITADLAARFHAPVTVGAAALAALLLVAALAVAAGRGVLRLVPARVLRVVTAVVLLGLAGYQAALAAGA